MRTKTEKEQTLAAVLAGPHAVIATQVVEFLKNMTPASANALLTLMRTQTWADMDTDTRFVLLREINEAVARARTWRHLTTRCQTNAPPCSKQGSLGNAERVSASAEKGAADANDFGKPSDRRKNTWHRKTKATNPG